MAGAALPHPVLLLRGRPGQFARSLAASGQASFCGDRLGDFALNAPWHLSSLIPVPQAGTPVTGAVVRVGVAWHLRPELSPRCRGAKPLLGGSPSSAGAGLPQRRAASRPPNAGGPSPSCLIHCQAWRQQQGRQRAEQPLAASVLTFQVRHWLDPPRAPCQALWRVALGGLVWPQPSFSVVGWGPRCSWPAPRRRPLGKVRGQDILPMGAEVGGCWELGTDGARAPRGCPAGRDPAQGLQSSVHPRTG